MTGWGIISSVERMHRGLANDNIGGTREGLSLWTLATFGTIQWFPFQRGKWSGQFWYIHQ